MTIKPNREELKNVIGNRLFAARKAAGLSSESVSKSIGHKNSTQISLIESGERKPSLETLIQLADLYAVPLDFVTGRTDDPIADTHENNQGVISHCIQSLIANGLSQYGKMIAEYSSMAILNHSHDRVELIDMAEYASRAAEAVAKIRKLNPEFDDTVRGGATLDAAIRELSAQVSVTRRRLKREKIARDAIEKPEEVQTDFFQVVKSRSQQFILDFVNPEG